MMNCRACSITFVLYMRYGTVSFLSFGTDWPERIAEQLLAFHSIEQDKFHALLS